MSSLACGACGTTFESVDAAPRCPTCLRKTTVVDPRAPRIATSSGDEPAPPFSWRRFAARTALGTIMVLVLGGGMVSRSSLFDANSTAPFLFAVLVAASVVGGVILAIAWTLFPRTRMGGL